jgi:heme exporter protein D
LQARIAAHLFPWRAVTVTLVLFAAFCAALLRGRRATPIWLFLAACCTGWIGYYGAIGDNRLGMLAIGGNGRYVFLPEVLAALAMLALAAQSPRPERWVARAAVGWLILIGVLDLRTPDLVMKTGSSWRQEVALWRQDHTHPIAIWPQGWFMILNHE